MNLHVVKPVFSDTLYRNNLYIVEKKKKFWFQFGPVINKNELYIVISYNFLDSVLWNFPPYNNNYLYIPRNLFSLKLFGPMIYAMHNIYGIYIEFDMFL